MTVTRRINTARGHRYQLDGEHCDGVTTLINKGLPKPALVGWAARTIAEYVADRITHTDDEHWTADQLAADLEQRARTNRRQWRPGSRIDIVEQLKAVHYDDRDKAANRGTEIHNLAQQLAHGIEVDVPEPITGHVDSYLRFLEEWDPAFDLVEATVINRHWRYMGTLDAVATMRSGRLRYLIDLKTTRSGVFPDVALQLAAYRYAETVLHDDGTETPMPEVDGCAVLWLRADGYDLVPVTAGPAEHRLFLYVTQIARWTETNRDLIGESLTLERTP